MKKTGLFLIALSLGGLQSLSALPVTLNYLQYELPDSWQRGKVQYNYMRPAYKSPNGTILVNSNYGYDLYTVAPVIENEIKAGRFMPEEASNLEITVQNRKIKSTHGVEIIKYAGTYKAENRTIGWQYYVAPNYRYRGTGEEPTEAVEGFIFSGTDIEKDRVEIEKIIRSIKVSKENNAEMKRYRHPAGFSFQVPSHWPQTIEMDTSEFRITSLYGGYIRTEVIDASLEEAIRNTKNGHFKDFFADGKYRIRKEFQSFTPAGSKLVILQGSGDEPQLKIMSSSNYLFFVLFKLDEKKTGSLMIFGSIETGKPLLDDIIKSVRIHK